MKALAESGERGMVELIMATHAGMTTADFEKIVTDWLATARHPRFKRPYTELVYQPMLELLTYLAGERLPDVHRLRRGHRVHATVDGARLRRASRAGCGIEHQDQVRNARWNARAIPPPTGQLHRRQGGQARRHQRAYWARPIAAFGNSDGDLEMLQWATLAGDRRRFGMIVHHTDAERDMPTTAISLRSSRHGPGRGGGQRLDRRQHERRLDRDFPHQYRSGDQVNAYLAMPRSRRLRDDLQRRMRRRGAA